MGLSQLPSSDSPTPLPYLKPQFFLILGISCLELLRVAVQHQDWLLWAAVYPLPGQGTHLFSWPPGRQFILVPLYSWGN